MHLLTPYQIAVTSNEYIPQEQWTSPFGYITNNDRNNMCRYCFNENTDIIRHPAELERFKLFYNKVGITNFTVIHYWMCTAVFSYYKK